MSAGVLSNTQVRRLTEVSAEKQVIYSASESPLTIDGSSMDLAIGSRYWQMGGSCRTGPRLNVRDIRNRYAEAAEPTDVGSGLTLRKGRVYLFEADCGLDLRDTAIQGKATARSSIGRLDVLVRLLVDGGTHFDRVPIDHNGALYIEVAPITFDLHVKQGTRLSQLRLYRGPEHLITLSKEILQYEEDDQFPVVDSDGRPVRGPCRGDDRFEPWFPFCLDLTPDPVADCAGFAAKREPPGAVDPDPDPEARHDPRDFWEPISAIEEDSQRAIRLEPDRLYIWFFAGKCTAYPAPGSPEP